jgi:hypothetical protein
MMANYETRSSIRWALGGKEKVQNLRKQLDAHIKTLDLATAFLQL